METKIRDFIKLLGNRWMFRLTLLIFAAEGGWLALTSAFPMAYDEAYHFGLIEFYGHWLNPIITSQPPGTYGLGALVQNPSFLYHYLMGFPYRLVALFTGNPETQVICLRLLNVALALAGLFIMRKLLKQLRLSDALANVLILVFALTPMFMNLSAQLNYDNLLIPAVSLCAYLTLLFMDRLAENRFDTRTFLALSALCLFSSLIKFAFLPVFVAIALLLTWKIVQHPRRSSLAKAVSKDFAAVAGYQKSLLCVAVIAGALLFGRFYGVDMVRYHNPAPQCNQILSVRDCEHYYAWNNNYQARRLNRTHPPKNRLDPLQYDTYWLAITLSEPFVPVMPLQGPLYDAFMPLLVIAGVLGSLALVCVAANIRQILRNPGLRTLVFIGFVYVFFLWARNYHDYLQLGRPAAINGRYLLPVLIFLYAILAVGIRQAADNLRSTAGAGVRAGLALILIVSFLYYGGFRQYLHSIDPVYGRISPADDYDMDYTVPNK